MKILVSGHYGYIGSSLVPMLLKEGFDVVGMDSNLYRDCTFNDNFTDIPSIEKDIRDAVIDDFEGVDAVIHLAALSNDPLGNLNPDITYNINHLGTIHLAEIAKAAGVKRFLFSSSCSNYGAAGENFVTEEAELNPVTPYGISKVRAENDLLTLGDDSFCPVFMRNATAYGVSHRHRFDLVVNNLTAWAFASGEVLLKSDGSPWRPLVHIEDISTGFISALKADRDIVFNQAFNIGHTDENYQIRDVALIVKDKVPNSSVGFDQDAGPDKRNYRVDCSKAAEQLEHFKLNWNVPTGVESLYQAYLKNKISVDEFEGPRYKRIDHIKKLIDNGIIDDSLRFIK